MSYHEIPKVNLVCYLGKNLTPYLFLVELIDSGREYEIPSIVNAWSQRGVTPKFVVWDTPHLGIRNCRGVTIDISCREYVAVKLRTAFFVAVV